MIVARFAVFSFFNAVQGDMTAVHPIEILPAEIRSTGVGFGAACSPIGAAAGTFLLPVGIEGIGIGPCMVIAAAVCVGGALLPAARARDDGQAPPRRERRAAAFPLIRPGGGPTLRHGGLPPVATERGGRRCPQAC